MEDFDTLDYLDEEDDDTFAHDEDSDYPNSIIDDEPEKSQEEQIVQDIIHTTLSELEDAIDKASGSNIHGKPASIAIMQKGTALKALQLLKAYSALYTLTYEDYEFNYD